MCENLLMHDVIIQAAAGSVTDPAAACIIASCINRFSHIQFTQHGFMF